MKLYYYKSLTGNFGDDLNPWLWPKLIPEIFDEDHSTLFVGIGTLLNHRIPKPPSKVIFGTGLGYGEKPSVDDRWHFYCVRGPKTAHELGLPADLAITDSAALVRTIVSPASNRDGGAAYMPHFSSCDHADWPAICQAAGLRFIDPGWPVEKVLDEIRRSSVLITEAMHGAIIADTLRVPWQAVSCYEHILDFKWLDWTSSLEMNYRPVKLYGVWDSERYLPLTGKLKNSIKRAAIRIGMGGAMTEPPPPKSSPSEFDTLICSLANLAKSPDPQLSQDVVFNRALERLQTCLDKVRADYRR